MSTRSRICEFDPNTQSARSIYCHFDGYPASVGRTLVEHYNAPWRVSALMDLGDLSSLEAFLSPDELNDWRLERLGAKPAHPHDFEHPWPNVTVAYGRDRDEEHVECDKIANASDVLSVARTAARRQSDAEFIYVYDLSERTWYFMDAWYVMAQGEDSIHKLEDEVARIVGALDR